MNLLSDSTIMMPVPISGGFTIDATPILIFGALVVAGYLVLAVKRRISGENSVTETTQDYSSNDVKNDNLEVDKNNSQIDSSEDNLEEDLYENYENDEELFTLNRR